MLCIGNRENQMGKFRRQGCTSLLGSLLLMTAACDKTPDALDLDEGAVVEDRDAEVQRSDTRASSKEKPKKAEQEQTAESSKDAGAQSGSAKKSQAPSDKKATETEAKSEDKSAKEDAPAPVLRLILGAQ